MRRGSPAHWMTFLSRTSHTVHALPGVLGRLTCPCSGRAAKSRSIPRGPRMAAQPAHTSIKRNSGSVAKFISARPLRQDLPPQPVLAERQRHCLPPLILCLIPAAVLALQPTPGSAVFQHAPLHLHCQIHLQTSRTSIPYIDRINFLFRRYSFVRVGPLFTSSTIFSPDTSRMYEKSAVYRIARTRSPVSVT